MLAAVYLLVASAAGFALLTRVVPTAPALVRLPGGFLVGLVLTSWTTYAVAWALAGATDDSLLIALAVSTVLAGGVLALAGRRLRLSDLRMPGPDVVLALVAHVVAWWFMHARLRTENGELVVSANTWGDLGLHGALSRSFSVGANYPTQYPFFAGEPIRYHFGFDFFAGMLQRGGFSLEWSFNLPGLLGFAAMLTLTFALARLLFGPATPVRWWRDRGVWTGVLAMALVLTNQSLGWLRYVQVDGGGSLATALRPSVLWAHEGYLTGGPYTDDRIVMFNTPNAYLTQTHLMVAMAVVLLLAWVVLDQLLRGAGQLDGQLDLRVIAGVGVVFGAAFWLNGVVWLAAAVFLGLLLLLWGLVHRSREHLLAVAAFAVPALVLGVPQALLLNGGGAEGGLTPYVGYLTCASTASSCHGGQMSLLSGADWISFVEYWWLNTTVFLPLLAVAAVVGSRRDRVVIVAAMGVFVWGNLVRVGLDVGGQNHKVFNLWENLAGLFVAHALVVLWCAGRRAVRRQRVVPALAGVGAVATTLVLTLLLTVSGVVDAMTVKNDFVVSVFGDEAQQEAMRWIIAETPPRATFLTDYDQLYTAPTLAGRGIALGYSSWASSAGYDIEPRKAAIAAIYASPAIEIACDLLVGNGLDYVVLGPQELSSPRFVVNQALFDSLEPAVDLGADPTRYRIYRTADIC